jgi:hypothetical protein
VSVKQNANTWRTLTDQQFGRATISLLERSMNSVYRTPLPRVAARVAVVIITVIHGLIHLMGAFKGFGWAEVGELREPISTMMGGAWLTGAALMVSAGITFVRPLRWWWPLGGFAAVFSQILISTAWSDAKAGTAANVILLVTAIREYLAYGPDSARSVFGRQAAASIAELPGSTHLAVLSEVDLADLPAPVAGYLRRCGAVGRPRVQHFHAKIHGRIRGGLDKPWMTFTGEQVNTYGPQPNRLFFIDATMIGLPVDVLHLYIGRFATMQVKVLSLLKMVNASGPELARAETVTLFNDMCVLAPAALVDAAITWQPIDRHRVRGSMTRGEHTVTADLVFDGDGYLEFCLDDITYNARPVDGVRHASRDR